MTMRFGGRCRTCWAVKPLMPSPTSAGPAILPSCLPPSGGPHACRAPFSRSLLGSMDALPVLQQRCPKAVERCLQELQGVAGCRGCRLAPRGPRMGPAARLGSVSTNSGAASGAQRARHVGKWLAKGCCSRTPHFFPRAGSAAGHLAQRRSQAGVHMQGHG